MTQEQIIEYNKRCCDFLKNDRVSERWCIYENHLLRLRNNVPLEWIEMAHPQPIEKYHSDWNYIMEVVLAIKMKIGNPTILTMANFNGNINKALMSLKKELVVESINQFLIYYNSQNDNQ